jgi:sulfate adenylyltransferase subunit 1 (EFTu-like GTPase family)
MLFEDQLAALRADSRRKAGTQGDAGLALLVDGLRPSANRASRSTSPTASSHTDRRKFIVADTPGHEQYTRNMVTGASTADLAVILIDARKGVLTQTRRHSCWPRWWASARGAGREQDGPGGLVAPPSRASSPTYRDFAGQPRLAHHRHPGVGAVGEPTGDTQSSAAMPWYDGPPLMGWLESVEIDESVCAGAAAAAGAVGQPRPTRLPRLCRHAGLRRLRAGDEVRCSPRAAKPRCRRIVTSDGDLAEAVAGFNRSR